VKDPCARAMLANSILFSPIQSATDDYEVIRFLLLGGLGTGETLHMKIGQSGFSIVKNSPKFEFTVRDYMCLCLSIHS